MPKEDEEEPLFDYVAALKNQPKITAPRPMFGPSPRQRQRLLPSSAQVVNKQLASIYGKRDSVTESMKCATFGRPTVSATSSASSSTSVGNKSRWSNFAKTPSPPRETPKFIKARITLDKTCDINKTKNGPKVNTQTSSSVHTAVKQLPTNTNRLFQTPSQTINATAFMGSNAEDRTNPDAVCNTVTKIQKLKQTGLYDKIRSLTARLQIDEDDDESDADQETEIERSTVDKNGDESRIRNDAADGQKDGGQSSSSEGEDGSSSNAENDSNVPNKFMVNDSIMIIKETFSAKKKMMQLGMLPIPRLNQYPSPKSPEVPSLRQQSLLKYFNKVDSSEIPKVSTSAADLKKNSDPDLSKCQERSLYGHKSMSKSETSVYEVSIPVNALQTSVANESIADPKEQSHVKPMPSSAQKRSLLEQKKITSASASNLYRAPSPAPPPPTAATPKAIKSSSCTSVNDDNQRPNHNNQGHNDSNASKVDLKKLRIRGKVYYLLSMLGQGGSAKVYQVYDPSTQKNLAVKVVDLMKADASTRAGYENEIVLLQKLSKCKRVVQLIDYERIKGSDGKLKRLFLVMEKGDADLSNVLKQFIEKDSNPNYDRYVLDPHLVKHYWKEMLKAVDEIHSLGVVHSDLKPVNFITVSGRLKLIDFGIANAIESDCTSVIKDNQIGTINYMAPESLQSRTDIDPRQYYSSRSNGTGQESGKSFIKYNCKADIWSLGCILYNLVYGKPPFGHLPSLVAKIQGICNPNFAIAFPMIDDTDLIDCLKKCLDRDPRRRPTAKELLEHPYLTRVSSSSTAATASGNHRNETVSSYFKTPEPPQSRSLASQISSLTPTRYQELSKFLQNLTKK